MVLNGQLARVGLDRVLQYGGQDPRGLLRVGPSSRVEKVPPASYRHEGGVLVGPNFDVVAASAKTALSRHPPA